MKRCLLVVAASIVLPLCCGVTSAGIVYFEDFDEPGNSWTETMFSSLAHSGSIGGPFEGRGIITCCVPGDSPPLPINQYGDKEAYLYNKRTYAMMPVETFDDVAIDGYVAMIAPDIGGSLSGGFALRAQGMSAGNSYITRISKHSPSQATFSIARVKGGIITNLVQSPLFSASWWPAENFHITFSATGSVLSASLSRVRARDGQIVEWPIDMSSDPGVQEILSVSNSALSNGYIGASAFAGSDDQRVLFDDVSVVPEPTTLMLLALGSLALLRRPH